MICLQFSFSLNVEPGLIGKFRDNLDDSQSILSPQLNVFSSHYQQRMLLCSAYKTLEISRRLKHRKNIVDSLLALIGQPFPKILQMVHYYERSPQPLLFHFKHL